jgi:RNA polymerase sigma-70 factor, ECF subfamily
MKLIPTILQPHNALRQRAAALRPELFRLAYMWCRDRALADDLTQDALAKALQRAGQLRDADKLRAWLCGILVNCWRDYLRAARPFEDIDTLEEHGVFENATPEAAAAQGQLAACVRDAVGLLPLAQREVLGLVDLEGCTYAEVAEILCIPIGTVMSRLCRARAALRARLSAAPLVQAERALLRRVK